MATVNVDDAAYQAFTRAVFAKHGKLRGALRDEATAALRARLQDLEAP